MEIKRDSYLEQLKIRKDNGSSIDFPLCTCQAFLIQDMFPITEEYIEREYTIAGNLVSIYA